MKMSMGTLYRGVMKRGRKAFTLIELLVVIGIIAIMVGVLVGVLGGGGNSSTALQSAQGTMSSLLASARAQAALTGYNAALFVNDNKDNPDRYLRYCVIAVYQPDANGNYTWVAANDGVYLPKGAYVVPPDVASQSATGVSFAAINVKGFDGAPTKVSVTLNATSSEPWLVLGISPLGSRVDVSVSPKNPPAATANGSIVLSTADPQPPGSQFPILFNNAQNVRGMSISQYGVAGFINDASGFQ